MCTHVRGVGGHSGAKWSADPPPHAGGQKWLVLDGGYKPTETHGGSGGQRKGYGARIVLHRGHMPLPASKAPVQQLAQKPPTHEQTHKQTVQEHSRGHVTILQPLGWPACTCVAHCYHYPHILVFLTWWKVLKKSYKFSIFL